MKTLMLGQGYFGQVHRAGHLAIKKYKHATFQEQANEFYICQRLPVHPNIIRFIGYFSGPPNGLAFEYFKSVTLEAFVQERHQQAKHIPPKDIIPILIQIAEGLACLHEVGIVHRDIALRNILINPNAICKLIDFGLSIMRPTPSDKLFKPNSVHVAPDEIVTSAVDIYAFGVVMIELITLTQISSAGSHNVSDDRVSLLHDVSRDAVLNGAVYRSFLPVIRACLEPDSVKRITAEGLLGLLDRMRIDVSLS